KMETDKSSKHSVLLIEQNTYLGGQSVACMTSQWKINAFRKNVGLWRMKGIGYEMVEKIVRLGGSDRLWEDFLTMNGQKDAEFPYLGPVHDLTGEEAMNLEAIK